MRFPSGNVKQEGFKILIKFLDYGFSFYAAQSFIFIAGKIFEIFLRRLGKVPHVAIHFAAIQFAATLILHSSRSHKAPSASLCLHAAHTYHILPQICLVYPLSMLPFFLSCESSPNPRHSTHLQTNKQKTQDPWLPGLVAPRYHSCTLSAPSVSPFPRIYVAFKRCPR